LPLAPGGRGVGGEGDGSEEAPSPPTPLPQGRGEEISPYASMISLVFFSSSSSIFSSYCLSSACTCSLPASRSSSVISLSFSAWSKCLLLSRRMFRQETLAASADFLTCVTI